jgi:Mn2+/Fe2+ NRAMP family transporter
MGPGLILSAAIVGSGELIATTTLGAKAGFALLWVVLLGCVVKVAVQVEYGRQCILQGATTYQAWNRLGKRTCWPGLHWTVMVGVAYMVANMAGQAGVLGGAAQVVGHVATGVPLPVVLFGLAGIIGLILIQGRYEAVEAVSTAMNVVFVGTVLAAVVALQWTPYRWGLGDLADGFGLRLPASTLGLAVAAFGITGVAAGEIAMYPYWCLEKGYARWTGPRSESPEWADRARGWIRVMMIDAGVSMAIYTAATCGFYVLGASVLHEETVLQDGDAFVVQLAQIFTEVLGPGARWLFLICAFTVLFSTVFANAAGFSRLWTDCFGLLGWLDWHDTPQRSRWTAWIAVLFALACAVIYLMVRKPLLLVTFMGICNALFLLVVGYQAVRFRYGPGDPRLSPGRAYDVALWVSLAAIGFMAVRTVASLIR